MSIPDEEHTRLNVGFIRPDRLRRVSRIIGNHIDLIVAEPLEALDVEVALPGEHVDPITSEFTDADIDEEGIAVLDRWRH